MLYLVVLSVKYYSTKKIYIVFKKTSKKCKISYLILTFYVIIYSMKLKTSKYGFIYSIKCNIINSVDLSFKFSNNILYWVGRERKHGCK